MENDSIRASGTDTLVDIWINGKMRSICISQEAIGACLDFERMSQMTDDDRCAFVRSKLPQVVAAAKASLSAGDPNADAVTIEAGDLPHPEGRSTDRRKSERRKTERRKVDLPLGGQPDRRRANRRRGERRSRPPKVEG